MLLESDWSMLVVFCWSVRILSVAALIVRLQGESKSVREGTREGGGEEVRRWTHSCSPS